MNLANILTLSRVVLAVFFAYFLFSSAPSARWVALFLFILAALTDWWDGLAARGMGETSHFGKLMDPIADKTLTLAAFISFSLLGLVPWWAVAVIVARDVYVTAARLRMSPEDPAISAKPSGKKKTALQMFYIILVLFYLIAIRLPSWRPSWNAPALVAIHIGMGAIVLMTLWSGAKVLFKK